MTGERVERSLQELGQLLVHGQPKAKTSVPYHKEREQPGWVWKGPWPLDEDTVLAETQILVS